MGEKDHLKIKIGNRLIGSWEPAYLIAEMSANHAGSIERAKEIIHAAKESGADCIKIQTYTPDTLFPLIQSAPVLAAFHVPHNLGLLPLRSFL